MTDQLVLHSFYRTRTVCVKGFVRPAATRQSKGGKSKPYFRPLVYQYKNPLSPPLKGVFNA